MMHNPNTGLVPSTYQPVEYIERPSSVTATQCYNTLPITLDATKNYEIRLGVMPIGTTQPVDNGYWLGCRQNNTSNTLGRGIFVNKANTTLGAFNGVTASVQPLGGSILTSHRTDLVVNFKPDHVDITDGINSDSADGTERAIASEMYIFGVKAYNSTQLTSGVKGRIYYVVVKENGTVILDLVPVRHKTNGQKGWYNLITGNFHNNQYYVAGPDVV